MTEKPTRAAALSEFIRSVVRPVVTVVLVFAFIDVARQLEPEAAVAAIGAPAGAVVGFWFRGRVNGGS